MSEMEFRFKEIERRMDRVERAAEQVPIIARDVHEIKADVVELRQDTKVGLTEVRDDQRSIRRALYTAAISVAGSSILFLYGVTELFK